MKAFLRRLSYYLRRRRFEADLDEEMAFHRELSGERKFGNTARLKEESRAVWSWPTLDSIGRDLRYGLRRLVRSPGFTAVAVISLALGTGANTAAFQLLNAVRFRALPVPDPSELVEIRIAGGNGGFGRNTGWASLTYPVWELIRDNQEAFDGVFAWARTEVELGEGADTRIAQAAWVSGEAFPTLGIAPLRGRLLGPEDDQPGCPARAVISHGLWLRAFGGADSAIGSDIVVRGRPVTVVGVTPPEFFGIEVGRRVEVFMPFCVISSWTPGILAARDLFWLGSMGRLRADWSAERAAAHLETASASWFQATAPDGYERSWMALWDRFRLTAEPRANGVSVVRGTYGSALWLLFGISALLLAITCVNLANLMLAQSTARGREIGVRVAIGASRGRVLWQIFWESLLLAGAGAAAGVGLAAFLSRSLVGFIQRQAAFVDLDVPMDWRVLAFVGVTALAVCLVLALAAGLLATRTGRVTSVTSATRDGQTDRQGLAFQRPLISIQVAVSLVLVASSLLFVRSFVNLVTADAGFRQEGLVFQLLDAGPDGGESLRPLLGAVLEEVRATPGVEAATTSTHLPLSGNSWYFNIRTADGQEGGTRFTSIGPGYFDTMEIPLLAGRDFSTFDDEASSRVVVVNETFARQYFGDADPIGRTMRTLAEPGYPESEFEIVGVVANTRYLSLREEFPPIAYAPYAQHIGESPPFPMIVVRSVLAPTAVASAIQAALRTVAPGTDVAETVDIRTLALAGMTRDRMLAWIAGFFGLLSIGLAATGLYGVVSCVVETRRGEIGVRLALGARRPDVVWMVLRQVAVLTLVGIALGLAVTLAVSGAARAVLFGLEPTDPLTLLAAAGILLLAGLWAGLVPARRAASIDPRATLLG